MKFTLRYCCFVLIWFICFILFSCNKKDDVNSNDGIDTTNYDPNIPDDYASIASRSDSSLWGPYNLHDPSIIKSGSTYYIFSTDVAFGPNGKCGIMWRTSEDLVKWQFRGWVFNGVPAKPLHFMENIQAGYQQNGIWAPYIIKVGSKFRLYYSVPGNNGVKLACIALATSTSPTGPWTDEGIVISCYPGDNYNAIDPSIIVDANNGRQWMTYGSYSAGIFIVELDPATGLRLNNSKSKLLAFRKKFGDAIEGADILYNTELKKYFLFVSYDWLEDYYNVRVGRSDNPEGPYYDIAGNDMAAVGDNLPMITAEYKFENHSGWQGFGGSTSLHDGKNYYYVSQARLSSNKYFMDLHIHRMAWTLDGWPVISPERYVNVLQDAISTAKIAGTWEHIDLVKTTSQNKSIEITLNSDGTITGIDSSAQWQYKDNILTLSYNSAIYKAKVFSEWDWENKKKTIVYTGMNNAGYCVWGKKIL